MLPIPAIDIQNGKCVRLQKGDLSSTKIYFEKPIDAAAHWIKEGTKRLHLVDLDGAKSGKPENLQYVLDIKEKFPDVNLQLGGGVRDLETLDLIFSSGVDNVFETFVWLYLREPVTKILSETSAVSDANREYVLELPLTFAESSVSESLSQITLRIAFTSQSSVSVAWYDTVL